MKGKFKLLLLSAATIIACGIQAQRPKIGLTLSGGGAKGLAHIGILKAIDSAGIKVDYITGTSMGAIIGSLYSVGYSADSIERIARQIDWDLLLSNQSTLRSLFMEEKEEYGKYVLELPWTNNSFRLPSGVLEGQELWLKFSELFLPVYNKKNFNDFSIPFRCIGTDVGTGEAVIMQNGEIVTAIRSSMAIPSVFTAVDYKGRKLVDGGIVRNFPVRDVKDMGADLVIGSNVATGLLPSEKVRNVIQVLLQVAFFRESEDTRLEVPQCDIYIPFNMDKYTMGSFGQSDELIKLGVEEGRNLYPRLKALKDSLDNIYGKQVPVLNRLPEVNNILISQYEVKGTEKTSPDFFIHTMDFLTHKYYSGKQLANKVRQAFGTRYYTRITYSLQPLPDGSAKIIFEVKENPLTFAKLGIHYNKFSGIGVIANLTTRNFFIQNSRSLVSLNIGESFRMRAEHLQYLGRRKDFSLVLGTQFDRFNITTFDQYKQSGLYRQSFFKYDTKLQYSSSRKHLAGIGMRFEWIRYSPSITEGLEFKGKNNFSTGFAFYNYNTLDRAIFPRKGVKMDLELARVFRQHPNINFFLNGQPYSNPDSTSISDRPYFRSVLNLESYTKASPKMTVLLNSQLGFNFNYTRNVMNEFVVGGMNKLYRNQILFAGLEEGTVASASVASFQAGLRYQIFNNTYLTARSNIMLTDLLSESKFFQNPAFLSGYALTFSYNFALGPLDLSVMYCDQTRAIKTYINLGIPF